MPRPWTLFLSTLASFVFGCDGESASSSGSGGDARASSGSTLDAAAGGGGSSAGEACGWEGDDPGGLVATGSAVGQIIADVQGLTDQCGETRSLWDFAGGYRIVVLAEAW